MKSRVLQQDHDDLIGINAEKKQAKGHRKAKERALYHLNKGYHLSGRPLKRKEIYDNSL